jgi:serine/threonine protein kinase
MLVQLLQNNSDRAGYTKAVDYWSLGVTLFSLLTGSLPFRHQQVAGFISYAGRIDKDGTPVLPPEYKRVDSMLQGLQQQHKISAECAAVVRDFLEFDELKRLGGGKQGIVNVMAHPAFAKLEWALLEQKLVKPPFKGHVVSNCSSESDRADKNSVYESFHALLMSEAPDFVEKVAQCRKLGPREQMYFSNW